MPHFNIWGQLIASIDNLNLLKLETQIKCWLSFQSGQRINEIKNSDLKITFVLLAHMLLMMTKWCASLTEIIDQLLSYAFFQRFSKRYFIFK